MWYLKKPHIFLNLENNIPSISSTEIRKALKEGDVEYLTKNLHPAVYQYIKEKKLYQNKV